LLLLDRDRFHQSYAPLNVLVAVVAKLQSVSSFVFFVAGLDAAFIHQLLLDEAQLFLSPRNLLNQLALVEGLLRDHLAAQLLHLGRQSLLHSVDLLTHDVAPNRIQLVEDLRDGRLRQFAVKLLLDPDHSSNRLSRDPIITSLLRDS